MARPKHLTSLLAALVLALTMAACGGDDGGGEESTPGGNPSTSAQQDGAPVQGKQGGKLTVLATDDVDFIDPGRTYYQFGFMITAATQRTLYRYPPDDPTTTVPDLAEGPPEISEAGKKVTIRIKPGVKFSPPVNREVTSKDVKYAIERGFFETVANGYAGAYYGAVKGAKVGVDAGTKIPGITTPDDRTIVFELTKPVGGTLAAATVLSLSAPVPEEYAKKFDAKNPSTYGENHVATGPYMIENDAKGKLVGYQAGRRIHLVRNPNWDKATDDKPALLDEIDIPEGNDNTAVAARRILSGESFVSGDFSPDPPILKQALTRQKDQVELVPSGGNRYVSMNTTIEPFDDINVRKAVIAGFDREAMRKTRGGEVVGDMPTHFIPPGIPGFEEAGGMEGPGLDFLANPSGDLAVAAEYFKKAGYASGKYEGDEEILMVGSKDGIVEKAAQVTQEQFEKLGFKVRLRLVTHDAMYTKFCNVPRAKVAVCPNVGWLKDFQDGQTMMDPTFNGENILQESNSNWSELNVKELNEAMNRAKELSDPAERAKAWGDIDRRVTEQAPAVPWIWDKQSILRSANVAGVVDKANANWHLAYTGLK